MYEQIKKKICNSILYERKRGDKFLLLQTSGPLWSAVGSYNGNRISDYQR